MAPSAPGMPSMRGSSSGTSGILVFADGITSRFIDSLSTERTFYGRVWECYNCPSTGSLKKISEEPIGVITTNIPKQTLTENELWVKHDGEWKSSHQKNDVFVRAYPITKEEYETDLAFDLFPKLKITSRPVRTYIEKRKGKLYQLNLVIASIASLPLGFQCISWSDKLFDMWFTFGVAFFIHAGISIFHVAFQNMRDDK